MDLEPDVFVYRGNFTLWLFFLSLAPGMVITLSSSLQFSVRFANRKGLD